MEVHYFVVGIVTYCYVVSLVQASSTCWDGLNAVDYTGTISVTASGRTCQKWALDSPHAHTFHSGAPNFPNDNYSDITASNYCRDPDGSQGVSGPFCYTIDPSTPTEACSIPICSNPACPTGSVVGQADPSTVITNVLTYEGAMFVPKHSSYRIHCCGTIKEWRIYIRSWYGTIHFQAWRENTSLVGNMLLLGENTFYYNFDRIDASESSIVNVANRIAVKEGDYIGWYMPSYEIIPYEDQGTGNDVIWYQPPTAPIVGDNFDFTVALTYSNRDYAIGAILEKSVSPYFTNAVTTASISVGAVIGTTVYTVSYTDHDVHDISTLSVTMDTNAFFNFEIPAIKVRSALEVGSQTLRFTVTDRCGASGQMDVIITVEPLPVAITSLPTTESVGEAASVETLVHTLTFNRAGTYTCTLDAYSPTRPEGNPFLARDTGSGDIGIYLKAAANVRFLVTTSYNVTVTCTEASTARDTSYLIIEIDQNTAPVFTNFQSSVTVSANTALNTAVYTATITNNLPVVVALTCDPSPCPFNVDNSGKVTVAADLQSNGVSLYTWSLEADDTYNTVVSQNISVIITDINVAPTITNLNDVATVLENQPIGTSVYHVSYSDVNGDTPTFSASFTPAACASMYNIGTSDGIVSTRVALDFESDPSCSMVVDVFDGRATSSPGTLTINVADVDETPVWLQAGYTYSTPEVPSGTALAVAGISATDPEGAAISYSIGCGSDSGYLTVDPTSGAVTMTAAFDLEVSAVNTHTLACTLTAADATGQSSGVPFNVIITDANDKLPVFNSASYPLYFTAGTSGTSVLGCVSATDADRTSPNNVLSYAISPTTQFNTGGDGCIFNTADLSGAAVGATFSLTMTATDGGTPPLSDTAVVMVIVVSTTTTTTTTTAATTAAAASTGSEESTGFLSSTESIVFFVLACVISAMLAAVLGFLVWKFCCRNAYTNGATKVAPNQGTNQSNKYEEYSRKPYPKAEPALRPPPEMLKLYEMHEASLQVPIHPGVSQYSTRQNPLDKITDRPDSSESGISVSSATTKEKSEKTNEKSALGSVLRTARLTNGLESPRTPRHVSVHGIE